MNASLPLGLTLFVITMIASPLTVIANDKTQSAPLAEKLGDIPEAVTSFGAAILNHRLYIYGGHTGRAHSYSREAQAKTLRVLDLATGEWQVVNQGPGLQGLAMLACEGKLYRVGGFMAKNEDGEDHDLWSQANLAVFDPAKKTWSELEPMPQPRSSFDAAVLDGKLYVVGGWKMAGDAKTQWHETALVFDPQKGAWDTLPTPPFQRRALAVAAFEGRLYVIGGMQQQGGPTRRVDIYDPSTKKWSTGPELQGKRMDGFGPSAFATGGKLYASTYSGTLQQLSADGKRWEVVKKLNDDRFFHRMLPLSEKLLISVGGASMSTGKFEELELIKVGK